MVPRNDRPRVRSCNTLSDTLSPDQAAIVREWISGELGKVARQLRDPANDWGPYNVIVALDRALLKHPTPNKCPSCEKLK